MIVSVLPAKGWMVLDGELQGARFIRYQNTAEGISEISSTIQSLGKKWLIRRLRCGLVRHFLRWQVICFSIPSWLLTLLLLAGPLMCQKLKKCQGLFAFSLLMIFLGVMKLDFLMMRQSLRRTRYILDLKKKIWSQWDEYLSFNLYSFLQTPNLEKIYAFAHIVAIIQLGSIWDNQ